MGPLAPLPTAVYCSSYCPLYCRGLVACANQNEPNTNGSQVWGVEGVGRALCWGPRGGGGTLLANKSTPSNHHAAQQHAAPAPCSSLDMVAGPSWQTLRHGMHCSSPAPLLCHANTHMCMAALSDPLMSPPKPVHGTVAALLLALPPFPSGPPLSAATNTHARAVLHHAGQD